MFSLFFHSLDQLFGVGAPVFFLLVSPSASYVISCAKMLKRSANKWIYKFYNPINSVKDINWLDCLLSLHHWSVGLFYWFVYWWISSFNLSFELLPSCFRHPPMYFTAMYAIRLFDMLRANITAQVSYTDCIRSAQSSDHRCNEQKIAFNELLTLISSQFIYFISFGSIAHVLFLCFMFLFILRIQFWFDLLHGRQNEWLLMFAMQPSLVYPFFQFNFLLYSLNLNHSQQFKM